MTDSIRGPDQPDPGSHGNDDGWAGGERPGVALEELMRAYAEAIMASAEMVQRIERDRNNFHCVISMTIMLPMLDALGSADRQAQGGEVGSHHQDGVLDDFAAFMRTPDDEFSRLAAVLTSSNSTNSEPQSPTSVDYYSFSRRDQALLKRLADVCAGFDAQSPLGFSRALSICGTAYADALKGIEDHHTTYFTIDKLGDYKAIKGHADLVAHHIVAALERPEHWPHAKKELQALVLHYGLPRVLFGVVDVLLPGDRLDLTNDDDRLFFTIFAARAAEVDSYSDSDED